MAFAKLYELDDFGQVLLLLDQNERMRPANTC